MTAVVSADNVPTNSLVRHARRLCLALVSAGAAVVPPVLKAQPASPAPMRTQVQLLDGHRVMLDVYPAAGPVRGAAILSHGFTRSRRRLAGHAQALADVGVLVLTPDLPCTCVQTRASIARCSATICRSRDAFVEAPREAKASRGGVNTGGVVPHYRKPPCCRSRDTMGVIVHHAEVRGKNERPRALPRWFGLRRSAVRSPKWEPNTAA